MSKREMRISNVCSICDGPYTSAYDKGRCLACGNGAGKMVDIAEELLLSDYVYMTHIEDILGQDFWEIIRNFHYNGVILRKKNMIGFTNALRWLKEGIGLERIRSKHTMANICIKDNTPIPWEDAYHLIKEGYGGLENTHWTKYQEKQQAK